ncbi:hypothetical protein OCEANICA350_20054 [Oceanicaulis sp. 350]|nr:hypothetical protein OCEANICA350_20054 [Oceanicaulis sp. 350]
MQLHHQSALRHRLPLGSGMGGSFIVSIVSDLGDEHAIVHIWYDRATPDGWEAEKEWKHSTSMAHYSSKLIKKTSSALPTAWIWRSLKPRSTTPAKHSPRPPRSSAPFLHRRA